MKRFTKWPKQQVKAAVRWDSDHIRFTDGEYRIKGLSDNALKFMSDIMGQLSDGYWENSRIMEFYWPYVTIDGSDVLIKNYNRYYNDRNKYCKFGEMSESHIKQWFADKIKQLAKEESGQWSRNSDYELDWLHGTVADAYAAYDELKGRSGHTYGKKPEAAEVVEDDIVTL